jgi:hypothetical protein
MDTNNWEGVADNTSRLEVPGGWLYRCWIKSSYNGGPVMSITFVPEVIVRGGNFIERNENE